MFHGQRFPQICAMLALCALAIPQVHADTVTVPLRIYNHVDRMNKIAWTHDGSKLLVPENQFAVLYDRETSEIVRVFTGATDLIYTVAISADGTKVFAGDYSGEGYLWDAATGTQIRAWTAHGAAVSGSEFSPDSTRLVTSGFDGRVRTWNLASGALVLDLQQPGGGAANFLDCGYSPDGTRIAGGTGGSKAFVWSATNGLLVAQTPALENAFQCQSVEFSPDGTKLLTAFGDGYFRILNIAAQTFDLEIKAQNSNCYDATYAAAGARIVTAGADSIGHSWNAATGESIADFISFQGQPYCVRERPGSEELAFAGALYQVLFMTPGASVAGRLEGHQTSALAIAVHPTDGTLFTTGNSENTLGLFNTTTGLFQQRIFAHSDSVNSIRISADGSRWVTSSDDGTAIVWNNSDQSQVMTFPVAGVSMYDAAFSPDGSQIVTGTTDGVARVWNVATGAVELTLSPPSGTPYVAAVDWSPDGTRVFAGDDSGQNRFYNSVTGVLEWNVDFGFSPAAPRARFRPGTSTIVINGPDSYQFSLYNAATEQFIGTVATLTDDVTALTYSPDGAFLLVGDSYGGARLFKGSDNSQVRDFRVTQYTITGGAFSGDGSKVFFSDETGLTYEFETTPPVCGRGCGDFDASGCTDLNDFLFLLDNWLLDVDGTQVGIADFLALLDNWNVGPGC